MATNLANQLGIDEATLNELNKAMQDGAGIQLPFPALNVWAHNGDKRMAALKADQPVSYFGGWHIDADKLGDMQETGAITKPIAWKTSTVQGDSGEYTVCEARVIHFAPIAYRLSWLSKDGKSRVPQYDESHARSHLQYLALIGIPVEKHVEYLCPGVISVKGKGQTEAMKNALATWRKAIDQFRRELNAQRLPLFAWWLSVGTSGDQPDFVAIGQGSQTSNITPVKAVMQIEKPTAEYMAARFVGPANFTVAMNLYREAREWLDAWKKPAANDFTPQAPAEDEAW